MPNNPSIGIVGETNPSGSVTIQGQTAQGTIRMTMQRSTPGTVRTVLTPGTSVRMPVDATLTLQGAAADAKATGRRIRALETEVPGKVNRPGDAPNGEDGQYLRSNGDGTTSWETPGTPTNAQVEAVVESWLDDHPEATTSVQDGSITYMKLNTALQTLLDNSIDGGYVEDGSLYLTHNGEVVAGPFTGFGGGGGGSGGGTANSAVMSMENASGWAAKTVAAGASVNIAVSWSSIEDGFETGDGSMIVTVNGLARDIRTVQQGIVSVDVGEYLSTGANTVQIKISDSYANSRIKNFTLNVLQLSIESSFDESTTQSGAFNFPYVAYGEVRKTILFFVDNTQVGSETTAESGRQRAFEIPAQTHGAHTIDTYFTANVNGQIITSNRLHYDVIWLVSGNTTPVIASNYDVTEVNQYATINIPYRVYDPSSQVANVTIAIDNVTVSTLTNVDRNTQNFSYRMDTAGRHTVTITSGSASKSFTMTVNAMSIDAMAETQDLALYLTSAGRNNNEANPGTWTWGEGNGQIAATFSGFNWVSDGWQVDGDGVTMLRVAGNARVTIPYQIFANDFRTGGKTIEIEFKAHDVVDYDAPILTCLDNGRGLSMTAQYALLSSEQSELGMRYKEDDHIRLTFVVEKRSENRLMLVYVNAIPSGVVRYADQDDFAQVTPKGISIGSSDCAMDIYNIRIYDNNLTKAQVLGNWIADTQDGATMMDRFGRNNVYDEYGQIVISKLPQNLPYMILECPELPQYKGDKKTITGSYTDPTNPAKSFTFEGCQINVQGTSSAPYARKNYDMQFKQGFIMANGTTQENFELDSTVIPFNRFVVKADVASSEGANNVELVKLYCETSPYKTREMLANSKVRQGIFGFPIVIFWRNTDNGKTTFLGKYNFNFPKRAPAPYGYSGNMESWEFQNNTSNLMLFRSDYFDETMVADPTTGEEKEAWRYDYEARFPSDEWTDYTKLQELESFIFSTSRDHATGDALSGSVTYDGVTYTTDSADYRLAKFRNEFGNYAEVSSFIFYYIFTELFLMVDSRAKNLFIGFSGSDTDANLNLAIDRKAVAEPYDMDTGLGTNNEGALVFSYNLEDTDTLSGGEAIFNGQNSVLWCNLRDAFHTEIVQMYQTLRSNGVLSYTNVENRFEAHQAKWPEAVWIEDSWFKYIDPLIRPDPGKDATAVYLPMMQGSKVEQRRWWLSNRFKYMDSKWNAGDALSQRIQLRSYAKANVTVTPYADIYATVQFGSYIVQQRGTHGVPVTLVCPIDQLNDTETYIYSAPQVASVGDLSPLKVGFADFSQATKLQSVKLGSNASGYTNSNLNDLTLGTNPLLKTVDVRNCTALGTSSQKSVNLSGCPNIEEIYFDGTAVTGVDLPNGGVIRKLHLPGTITNLTIRNHSGITEFVCPDYSNLTTLWLENPSSAIDTAAIIDDMPTGGRVRLFNFHWELEDLTEVSDLFDKLDTMRGLDQNGNNTNTAQVYGSINVETADGTNYATIQARYPDVTITYDHIGSKLKYYNYDGSELLHTETIEDGAAATWNGAPTRTSTAQYDFTFAGWSRTAGGSADSTALDNVIGDRNVYAAYTNTLRSYSIIFALAQIDGGTTLETKTVVYGTVPTYTGSTPTSSNDDGGVYVFSGWSPELTAVTGAATYEAVFTDARLTITYMNGETVFGTEKVASGNNGSGPVTSPTKASTTEYTYTFAGWNANSSASTADADALNNVTSDRTVYAIYTQADREYTITFVRSSTDGGGTLQTRSIAYGTVPTYTGSTPTSTNNDGGIYQFSGWTPELTAVTGDATYTAVFTDISVTITYMNGNTQVGTQKVARGSNGTGVSTTPTKAQTDQYTYTFSGWNADSTATTADANALNNVTADLTVYAMFTATVRTYTVTFVRAAADGGGTLQTLNNVAYGTTPAYTGSTPTSTATGDWAFNGWSPALGPITGATTYTAVFRDASSPINKYLARTMTAYEGGATATKVASYAFYNMTTLTSAETYATTIESNAFDGCTNLEILDLKAESGTVTLNANGLPTAKLNAIFIRSSSMATLYGLLPSQFSSGKGAIYVPSGLVATYKAGSGWITYASHIFAIGDYPVDDEAFDSIQDSLSTMCTKLANGTADYNVGDFKTIDLGTEGKIRMQVAAKNVDELSTGGTNAAYTWVAMDLLNTNHRMNPALSGTTEGTGAIGGWGSSEMRTYLSTTIWTLIPAELQAVIKEVKKYSYIYDTSSTKVTDDVTNDKLWIPSDREVLNSSTYETTGPAYTGIFSGTSSRIRYKPGASSASNWWRRSAASTSNFRRVNYNGSENYSDNSSIISNGVLLGFCT